MYNRLVWMRQLWGTMLGKWPTAKRPCRVLPGHACLAKLTKCIEPLLYVLNEITTGQSSSTVIPIKGYGDNWKYWWNWIYLNIVFKIKPILKFGIERLKVRVFFKTHNFSHFPNNQQHQRQKFSTNPVYCTIYYNHIKFQFEW